MKTPFEFLVATVVTGAVILAPLVLACIVLIRVAEIVVNAAKPLTELLLPKDAINHPLIYSLTALTLLAIPCFIAGLAFRISLIRRCGEWLTRRLLGHLPGYSASRRLIQSMAGRTDAGALKPALVMGDGGARDVAYVMEEHGNGTMTVFIPSAPTPFVGSIKIVPTQRVEVLDVPLREFVKAISQWGDGMKAFVQSRPLIQGEA